MPMEEEANGVDAAASRLLQLALVPEHTDEQKPTGVGNLLQSRP